MIAIYTDSRTMLLVIIEASTLQDKHRLAVVWCMENCGSKGKGAPSMRTHQYAVLVLIKGNSARTCL